MVPFDQIVDVNRSEIVEGFEINEKKSCFIAPFIMLSFYYEFRNTLGAGKNLTFILILLNLFLAEKYPICFWEQ